MVIWKFPLTINSHQIKEMPYNTKILSVGLAGGEVCIWGLCNPTEVIEKRHFRVIATGEDIKTTLLLSGKFIGTVVDEPFVWHIFELK